MFLFRIKEIHIIPIFTFIIIISYYLTLQIKIPIKKIKTKFQKRIINNSSTYKLISNPLNALENFLFGVDLTIGSNKQPFTIMLDTGSEILWVPGIETLFSKVYIPSDSVSSSKSSEILKYEYTSGKVEGYYYSDQMNFLISNSFYAYFGVATSTNIEDFYFHGIMGLGRNYKNKKLSILETVKNAGGQKSTMFSFKYDYDTDELNFYFGEIHADFRGSSSGALTVGSCPLIDSESYGKTLWLCKVYSLGIKQGDTMIQKISFDIEGLFDTGTNNIIFPIKYMYELRNTIANLDCYLADEGYGTVQKAIYCRNAENLPNITIGVQDYLLTLGNSNFYNKIYDGYKIVYRLRFLFMDIKMCVIGQNFFYEFHTLFDDDAGSLKFYSNKEGKIVKQREKTSPDVKTWVLFLFMSVNAFVVIVTTIIFLCCMRKNNSTYYYKNNDKILLDKELLEMSSIKKDEDDDDDYDNNFNQIMNIKTEKPKKRINIKISYKNH